MATKLTLKLLVEKSTGKVFFGEAEKDFVDFLFSLLIVPIGYAAKLLSKQNRVGCTATLCKSLENLSVAHLEPNFDKNALLNPKMSIPNSGPDPSLLLQDGASTISKLYSCSSCNYHGYVTEVEGTLCPICKRKMVVEVFNVGPTTAASGSDGGRGCVKGVATYMVMDDLVVTPMSTISSIAVLNKLNVREVSAVEERVVEVGMDEALALLKASLESKTVLNDVFGAKLKLEKVNYDDSELVWNL
ncbi:uncharacterized protein LOC131243589 [Magnolia sinica]|uniref:uncharacterized protein LOC131243589 n=1 Tax=Magnolia sinica TaxID=86752 RepID=UPI00265AE3BB|nr:uncharacterized protein LOC131243589 [Magnolia sinica]